MGSHTEIARPLAQRQVAKDLIDASVNALIEQLERGQSNTLTSYLHAMSRFHRYSFGNILSIAHHCPDATRVAGIRTWNELGRFVKRGEKGIPIQAPLLRKRRLSVARPGQRESMPEQILVGFRTVRVFDITQTEGEDLPEFSKISGQVGIHRERLIQFIERSGIECEYDEGIAPAQGVSYGGRIALLPGQTRAEEFCTLVHELAHEMLHHPGCREQTNKSRRETEAEAVAFIVCDCVGLNTGSASADYINLYQGSADLLMQSLEAVQNTSAVIIGALLIGTEDQSS